MSSNRETIQATQRVETKPSKFIEGMKVHTYIYICPRCKKDLLGADHCITIQCKHCKLNVMVKGAAMDIWE